VIRRALGLSVAALLATPAGTFADPWQVGFEPYASPFAVSSYAYGVAVGDLNGDGRNDIVVGLSGSGEGSAVWVAHQLEGGSWSAPERLVQVGPYSGAFAVVDFDGDRKDDVIEATSAGVQVFRQQAGGLGPAEVLPGTEGIYGAVVEVADVNGDGRSDVVTDTPVPPAGEESPPSKTTLFVKNQTGPGYTARDLSGDSPQEVRIGDLTGDGRPDIVTLVRTDSAIHLFTQRPDGGFDQQLVGLPRQLDTTLHLGIGDVTGDARLDLVASLEANRPDAGMAVYRQQPGGGLAPPVAYPAYDVPRGARIADMNGDGRADVVTMHSYYPYSAVGVFLQQPSGDLDDELLFPADCECLDRDALAVADVSCDGRPDLVVDVPFYVMRQTTSGRSTCERGTPDTSAATTPPQGSQSDGAFGYRVLTRHKAAFLKRGFRLRAGCAYACVVRAELWIYHGARSRFAAASVAHLGPAGRRTMTLKPRRSERRRAVARRSPRIEVRFYVTDADGVFLTRRQRTFRLR
jgi:FG-GAP-like repeat/FG-GAP repeat